jgi:hypothetical protein
MEAWSASKRLVVGQTTVASKPYGSNAEKTLFFLSFFFLRTATKSKSRQCLVETDEEI